MGRADAPIGRSLRVGIDGRHARLGLGIASFATRLAQGLAGRDDITPIWVGAFEHAPADVEVIDLGGVPYPAFETRIGQAMARRHRLDLMHFTGNTGWTTKNGDIPVVLTIHDLIFMTSLMRRRPLRQQTGHRYARWNVQRAVRAARIVAASSHATAAVATRALGVAPRVVYLGVDQHDDQRSAKGGGKHIVVAFGGSDPRKRVDVALRGFLAAGLPRYVLHLCAGAGLPRALRREVEEAQRAGRIEVHPYLPRGELDRLVARALAVIYPSEEEGFGLPVLEAMALGTPCITGLAPATAEIGADAVVPLSPADPVGSCARALSRLAADDAFAAAVQERGRLRARQFDWRRCVDQYAALYKSAACG